ncbi:lipoprotein NlpI [Catenovulum maritimum]|nr:lipoprotein NlpI [Catenovulum maritimum]
MLKLLPILLCVFVVGCSQHHRAKFEDFPLANYKIDHAEKQLAIKRFSTILLKRELTQEQTAEILFRRGLLYQQVGLFHLAFFDLLKTIKLKPDFVEAYNLLGVYYVNQQEYEQAYNAFDTVIELDDKHEFAYFNRALALFYNDRADLALIDFKQFYGFNSEDGYRLIWLYFAKLANQTEEESLTFLNQKSDQITDNWTRLLVQLFQHKITPEKLIESAALNNKDINQYNERLCEAYFYIAKYLQQQNQIAKARFYFTAAISTQVYEFVEYKYAKLELAQLNKE